MCRRHYQIGFPHLKGNVGGIMTCNDLNFPSQYNSRIQWLLVLASSFRSFSALLSLYDFKESKTDRLTFLMDTEFISKSFSWRTETQLTRDPKSCMCRCIIDMNSVRDSRVKMYVNFPEKKKRKRKRKRKYQCNHGDQCIRGTQSVENALLPLFRFINLLPPIKIAALSLYKQKVLGSQQWRHWWSEVRIKAAALIREEWRENWEDGQGEWGGTRGDKRMRTHRWERGPRGDSLTADLTSWHIRCLRNGAALLVYRVPCSLGP